MEHLKKENTKTKMFHWNIFKERKVIMAVKLEFSISDRDFEKLRLLKKADGRTELTYNDYAEVLLDSMIGRMYREYDRQGLIKEDEDD